MYIKPGEFQIPHEDKNELEEAINNVAVKGFEKIPARKRFAAAMLTGYVVATENTYNGTVASFSTRTSLVEVNGRKYFVVYNYPGSQKHRKADTKCRKVWGEKALKATEEEWRDVFCERSLIPVHKTGNERVVVLPFIRNIGLVDILERFDDEKFHDEYKFGAKFSDIDQKLKLILNVAEAVSQLHEENRTWGEVIPANLGLSHEGKIMFFDPETPYNKETEPIEQKARDILSWCISSCGALHKSKDKFTDYEGLIHSILASYGDKAVIEYLQRNLTQEIKFGKTAAHPIAWGQLKARLTVSGKKQYNEIMGAIRSFKG